MEIWAKATRSKAEFLGIDGLIEGNEIFAVARDGIGFLGEDNLTGGGGETVLTSVSCGAGFAFGSARAEGAGRITGLNNSSDPIPFALKARIAA
jgi:hypothetical protein